MLRRARMHETRSKVRHAPRKLLHGKEILVTRPRAQAGELLRKLKRLGAAVIEAPAIRISRPDSWRPLDDAIVRLADYDAVVFTSANGVEMFFSRARRGQRRAPARPKRLYAIGPATARRLRDFGWGGVEIPESFEGAALAKRLGRVRGMRILLPRAKVARDVLPKLLRRAGARVEEVEAYQTTPDPAGIRVIRRIAAAAAPSAVTFTSASTAKHFLAAVGSAAARRLFSSARAVSIGPITSRTLRSAGIRRILEADPFTTAGVVRVIEAAARRGEL